VATKTVLVDTSEVIEIGWQHNSIEKQGPFSHSLEKLENKEKKLSFTLIFAAIKYTRVVFFDEVKEARS
jgi:hypothetical protein